MSRGRKKITPNGLDWESLFNKSVGSYFEYIIHSLGQKYSNQVVSENTPFPLPNDWTWSKFADIAELTENLNIEAKLPPETLIHYVDIDAIDNNAYRIREPKLKTVSELSSRARRVLKKGYLMYSLVRPYLNNIAIVEEDKDYYIGSTGFAVFKINQLDSQFIKLWLLSDYVKARFLDMISGFNSPSITMEQFLTTWVPVPPLEVQTKLLDFVDAFQRNTIVSDKEYFDSETEEKVLALHESQLMGNQLSTELTHQLDLVKQLRQSFLREAMQGKLVEPTHDGETGQQLLAQIKAEKAQLIAAKKLKKEKELTPIKAEEIPFEIPEHWTWCRLEEICQIKGGKRVPNGYKLLREPTPYIYIRVSDMKNGTISDEDLHYIDENVYQQIKQYTISKDDIYMTIVGGTIGKCGLVPNKFHNMNLTENAAKIIPHIVDKLFLWNCLDSPFCQSQFIDKTKQVGVQKMALNRFSSSLIPLPPLSEQQRIVEKLESLMQTCDALETSIKSSQGQNQQLLQQVLREALRK
jgi:type I restriction enzyme S subunit